MARVYKFAQKEYGIESELITFFGQTRESFTYNGEPVMGQGGIGEIEVDDIGDNATPNGFSANTVGNVVTLRVHAANATNGGVLTAGPATQSIGGNKTFTGTITAQNLSGVNTGNLTLSAPAASTNANAAVLTGQALALQVANGDNPGILQKVGTTTQQVNGNKYWVGAHEWLGTGQFTAGTSTPNALFIEGDVSANQAEDTSGRFVVRHDAILFTNLQSYTGASGGASQVVIGGNDTLYTVPNTAYFGNISVVAATIPKLAASILSPSWDSISPTNPIVTYSNAAPAPTIQLLNRGIYKFFCNFHCTQQVVGTFNRIFLQFLQGSVRTSLAPFASTSVYVGPDITGVENVTSSSTIVFNKTSADGVPHYLSMKALSDSVGPQVDFTSTGGLQFEFTPTA